VSEEDSLPFHHWLIADTSRTGTYQKAISQVVRKNDVVLDIGAGSGVLSFFACLAGARKVHAIEMSGALPLARELCAGNRFNDIVEFRQGRSQEIQLPEPVDVIVSDTGCSFGLQGGLLGILLDARKRFLKPGGRIIPRSLQLLVAPVEINDARNLDIWENDRYGLDLSSIRRFAANTDYHFKAEPETVLAPPASLTTIQFEEVSSPYVVGETLSVASRDGVMHGLAAWIVLELAPGISFTNSPLAPTVDWLHSFFPIERPVELRTGDRVRARIQTNNGEVWRWHVQIEDGNTDGENLAVKARFDHSTLWNFPLDPAQVKKQFPNYTPKLSRKGEAEKYLLGAFDGQRSAAELAAELLERFSDCFPSKAVAAQFVSRVIGRCT
jgi:protein arginine N-methyltransferase 1